MFTLVTDTAGQQKQHWEPDRSSIYRDCRELAASNELCMLGVTNRLKKTTQTTNSVSNILLLESLRINLILTRPCIYLKKWIQNQFT